LGERDIEHLRQDVGRVGESQLTAMFEASAEVLEGLAKVFETTSAGTSRPGGAARCKQATREAAKAHFRRTRRLA
jgi:hypothetical protein